MDSKLRVPSFGLTLRLLAEGAARPDLSLKRHPFTGIFATGITNDEDIRYVGDAPIKARFLRDRRFERARFLIPKATNGENCCFTEVIDASEGEPQLAEALKAERIKPVSALYQARAALGWPLPVTPYLKAAEAEYWRAYDVITSEKDLHPKAEAWIPLNLIVSGQLTQDSPSSSRADLNQGAMIVSGIGRSTSLGLPA